MGRPKLLFFNSDVFLQPILWHFHIFELSTIMLQLKLHVSK